MRVAVPVEEPSFEGEVCEHFGRARYFAVFSVKGDVINGAELVELPEEHGPGELPRLLKEKNVEVVLANRVGRKALAHFESLGIKVFTGLRGRAVDVVKAFLGEEV